MALVLPVLPRGASQAFDSPGRPGRTACGGYSRSSCLRGPPLLRALSGALATQRGALLAAKSSSHGMASNENDFDLSKYRLAEIALVRQEKRLTESKGRQDPPQWLILLKLNDTNSAVAVYVGEFEGNSLKQEIPAPGFSPSARPMTYDIMKNSLSALGARVTKVCITALIENTYHARVHYAKEGSTDEVVVDSRPSDALNMAVRFGAPVYVNRAVADKMAHPVGNFERRSEVPADVLKSCKEALRRYHDPTVVHKVNLQIAIQENRFEDATKIRNQIEKLLSQDRTLSLVVAMESALEDKRWEEAAFLRNELTALMDQIPEGKKLQDA